MSFVDLDRAQMRFVDLDKESFLTLIMEVVNA